MDKIIIRKKYHIKKIYNNKILYIYMWFNNINIKLGTLLQ